MTAKKNITWLSTRNDSVKRWARYSIPILMIAIPTSCSSVKIPDIKVPNIVYKIDIQQGNLVTQEMLNKLKRGMDKRKVRFILGTPLIVSAFDRDRWDYVYSFQSGGGDRKQSKLSLFFKDGKLQHIKGDTMKIIPEDQPSPLNIEPPDPQTQ
uniref:Outer membrane protein assembly factor BamE n=1 Tax=Candidatus Kentrum sp. LFY TaxID=2126342 RepID=A0A450U948_9GAMM|nr:MAG: outer membrane protein assembly factor BamE [Candidatus Kentron sp. LFY]